MTPPRARKCSRCHEPSDDGRMIDRRWVCDVCMTPLEEETPNDDAVDRFERAREDIEEHRRGLGLE